MSPHDRRRRSPGGTALLAALLLLIPAGGATAAPDDASLPPLVLFDPLWKDFQLPPPMKAEVETHMRDFAAKTGKFRIVTRSERERTIVERRIFVMGSPDEAKAAEIAAQAGWSYLLTSTFQGVRGKGVKITVVFRDLARGEAGVVTREKFAANHLKALRDTARALVAAAVEAGAAAQVVPPEAAAPPAAPPSPTPPPAPALDQKPTLRLR